MYIKSKYYKKKGVPDSYNFGNNLNSQSLIHYSKSLNDEDTLGEHLVNILEDIKSTLY